MSAHCQSRKSKRIASPGFESSTVAGRSSIASPPSSPSPSLGDTIPPRRSAPCVTSVAGKLPHDDDAGTHTGNAGGRRYSPGVSIAQRHVVYRGAERWVVAARNAPPACSCTTTAHGRHDGGSENAQVSRANGLAEENNTHSAPLSAPTSVKYMVNFRPTSSGPTSGCQGERSPE